MKHNLNNMELTKGPKYLPAAINSNINIIQNLTFEAVEELLMLINRAHV